MLAPTGDFIGTPLRTKADAPCRRHHSCGLGWYPGPPGCSVRTKFGADDWGNVLWLEPEE